MHARVEGTGRRFCNARSLWDLPLAVLPAAEGHLQTLAKAVHRFRGNTLNPQNAFRLHLAPMQKALLSSSVQFQTGRVNDTQFVLGSVSLAFHLPLPVETWSIGHWTSTQAS